MKRILISLMFVLIGTTSMFGDSKALTLDPIIVTDSRIYDAVCVTVKGEFTKVSQEDGYEVVSYRNKKYYYFVNSDLMTPENECKKNEIPLFEI